MKELINRSTLEQFIKERKLELVEKIAKGFSSETFLVKNAKGKKFALKIERIDSPRKQMVEREVENLKKVNSVKVGPKLADFDLEKRIILVEFIEGRTFNRWLFRQPTKEELVRCLKELFAQASRLDKLGLSHGQLAGKGTNILVNEKGLPVIIDFEKASTERKSRNVYQLTSFIVLNPHSALTKIIRKILQ
jgi:predicted Ser/Thr protein kinase